MCAPDAVRLQRAARHERMVVPAPVSTNMSGWERGAGQRATDTAAQLSTIDSFVERSVPHFLAALASFCPSQSTTTGASTSSTSLDCSSPPPFSGAYSLAISPANPPDPAPRRPARSAAAGRQSTGPRPPSACPFSCCRPSALDCAPPSPRSHPASQPAGNR
jgi:hypothetical protein